MIIDHLRAVLVDLPPEFSTRAAVRAVNRRRMAKGRHPVMRGGIKRDLFKLVEKGEIVEVAFNQWARRNERSQ
jgi:hypothetical protein